MSTGLIAINGSGIGLPNVGSGAPTVPGSPIGQSAIYTFAGLPSAASAPVGTILYSSDDFLIYSNGVSWVAVSTGGASSPSYSLSVTASPATTQNDYSPVGWSFSKNRLLLAAAAGDSTITGLSAAGFSDGNTILINNTSATDNLLFPHQSGSSGAGNRFNNAGGGTIALTPFATSIFCWISGIGWNAV